MLDRLRRHDIAFEPSGYPQAAVLIAVTNAPDKPELIYTMRSANMSSHAGEVSFPGGRADAEDGGDPWNTALRESWEEIGLQPDSVTRICRLAPQASRYGLEVVPCVGLVPANTKLEPTSAETDQIFHVAIADLLSDRHAEPRRYEREGVEVCMPTWHMQGFEIWGLTAMMTAQLLNIAASGQFEVFGQNPHLA